MSNILKKAIGGLLDQVLNPSKVLCLRSSQSSSMYEIDLHLPNVNMEKWNTIKRLKCKVGELEYRDYTPSLWDAEKRVCTIYIEAGHDGAGSRWARQLKVGDEVLFGDAHAAQLPAKEGRILCIGDGSALGHFLALKQLTKNGNYPMDAAILLHDHYQLPPLLTENPSEYTLTMKPDADRFATLAEWCNTKDLSIYTSIYIAGNIPMVTALRKKLKVHSGIQAKIYAHGFWS
jgi:NADPH-dependent ferric siderophore reductase